jgi:putative transposase
MNELKTRGVEDILIALVDNLKGFPEAINAVFPKTTVQTCIVHLIRNSLDFVAWKGRKPVVAELRKVYRAKDAEAGREALEAFDAGPWGRKYEAIGKIWRRQWEQIIPFVASRRRCGGSSTPPTPSRRSTPNCVAPCAPAAISRTTRQQSNCSILVLRQAAEEWKMPPREWPEAKTRFAIMFDERFVKP